MDMPERCCCHLHLVLQRTLPCFGLLGLYKHCSDPGTSLTGFLCKHQTWRLWCQLPLEPLPRTELGSASHLPALVLTPPGMLQRAENLGAGFLALCWWGAAELPPPKCFQLMLQ